MINSRRELELLRLLSENRDELGSFFARWDEIKGHSYTEDFINGIKDAPDLNFETEKTLGYLVEQGLVEHLTHLGTDQGEHFKITYAGEVYLKDASRPWWQKWVANIVANLPTFVGAVITALAIEFLIRVLGL
ncbi:hypothetical protein OE810_06645 [Rhodobacteraceae bacterium XHP0102]|nr:hypothetical protein [Rhodobacteraceae bacterium XHP0102]